MKDTLTQRLLHVLLWVCVISFSGTGYSQEYKVYEVVVWYGPGLSNYQASEDSYIEIDGRGPFKPKVLNYLATSARFEEQVTIDSSINVYRPSKIKLYGKITDTKTGKVNDLNGTEVTISYAPYPDRPSTFAVYGDDNAGRGYFTGGSMIVKPVRPKNLIGSPSGIHCGENTKITLTVPNRYRPEMAEWFVRVGANGAEQRFVNNGTYNVAGTNNSTRTFGLQEIFGHSYKNYIGQNLYFRTKVNTGWSSYSYNVDDGYTRWTNAYTFLRNAPDRVDYTPIAPQCPGGTGSVVLNNVFFGTTPYDQSFDMTYVLFSEALGGAAPDVTITANGQTFPPGVAYVSTNVLPIRFDGLPPGRYYFQVEPTGNAGKDICPLLKSASFALPAAPVLAVTQAAPVNKGHGFTVSCPNGHDGAIQVTVANGQPSFTYELHQLAGETYSLYRTAPAAARQHTFTDLPAGTYKAIVRDGCTPVQQQESPAVVVTEPPNPLTATTSSSPAGCHGAASGSAAVTISNGVAPYTFEIHRGGAVLADKTTIGTGPGHTFTGLAAGTYTIKVRDSYGCSLNNGNGVDVTVAQPDPVAFTTTTRNASCQGSATGAVRITATGGDGNYQYSRDNGTTWQTDNLLDNLAAGSYPVLVKDGKGCTAAVQTVTLSEPATLLRFAAPPQVTQPLCSFDTGTIGVSATDGTPAPGGNAYRFFVAGRADTLPGTAVAFVNLPAGTYTIGVKDASQCTQYLPPVTIAAPEGMTATPAFRHVSCRGLSDGEVTFTLSGGTRSAARPYQVRWYGAASTVPLREATATSTATLTGLAAGSYLIRIKDGNGCSNSPASEWFEVPFTITEPQDLQLAAQPTAISCFGETDGVVHLQVQGGTAPYQYSRDGVQFTTAAQFNGLPEGTHTFFVKDANGCSAGASTQIVAPAPLTSQVETIRMVDCYEAKSGSFSLAASGGTAPYDASVDNGMTWTPALQFEQLAAGTYSAIVRDVRNCRVTVSLTITQPAPLQVSLAGRQAANCGKTNGWVSVGVSGGTTPYRYAWFDRSGTEIGQAPTLSGIAAGTYQVRVTDANGCVSAYTQVSLSNSEGPRVAVTGVTPASCYDAADGRATVTVLSGAAPVSIRWPDGQTTSQVSNLSRGSYEVVITDGNGCRSYELITIDSPSRLTVEAVALQHPSCYKACDGALTVQASGGMAPYRYTWSFLAGESPALTGRCAGTYQVVVQDARGCSVGRAFELVEPLPVLVDVPDRVTICVGQSLTLDAGNPGASYQWQADNGFASTSRIVTLREAGRYTVKVTLADGCTGQATTEVVAANDLLQADFLAPTEAIAGDTIVLVEISRPEPTSARWLYADSVARVRSAGMYEEVVFPAPGTYTVTLVVGLGDCRADVSKQIKVLDPTIQASAGRLGYRETGIKQLGVYPNPTNGAFKALVELHEQGPVSLRLTDLQGGNIWASQSAGRKAYYEIPFNVPALKAGIYVLTVQTRDTAKTLRVTVYQ